VNIRMRNQDNSDYSGLAKKVHANIVDNLLFLIGQYK
jgi:hypothetical protein